MVYSAVHMGRHHCLVTARACVCLVVPRKMTQPIWDLDHLPKPAPRSEHSDICHPAGAKLSLSPSRLFQGSARVPSSDRESWPITKSREAFEGAPSVLLGCRVASASMSHLPATGSENPCSRPPRHVGRGRGPAGATSLCGLRTWLGNGPGLEPGDDVGLQTQAAAQKSREAIPGSSSGFRWAGRPGRFRHGGLESAMSGCSLPAPCRQVFPWLQL